MVCKNCGSEIPDDARSCPHCGEALKTEEKRPIESPTIDSSSNLDFKVYLDGEANSNGDSLYPQFYPNELKHLNKDESIPATFETTPVPSIEEIKRLSKYKSSSPEGGAIVAMIISGLISGILVLVGIFILPLDFPIGLTLIVFGLLFLFCTLSVASKGECLVCLTGC